MANFRMAMVYEDGEVFVELKPEVLIEILDAQGLDGKDIYDRIVTLLAQEFRRK